MDSYCSLQYGIPLKQSSSRKSRAQPARAGSLLLGLPPLREIFLGQRRSGRLSLHHDARNSPTAGFFEIDGRGACGVFPLFRC
jgi:hypothetical protein